MIPNAPTNGRRPSIPKELGTPEISILTGARARKRKSIAQTKASKTATGRHRREGRRPSGK
jgi:hypothetical protein